MEGKLEFEPVNPKRMPKLMSGCIELWRNAIAAKAINTTALAVISVHSQWGNMRSAVHQGAASECQRLQLWYMQPLKCKKCERRALRVATPRVDR